MDDRKIETLLAAVRTGSFSKTAEEMICTQSSVTQSMNSLENELGCKLLVRSRNGVKLSPEGEKLLPYIVEAGAALSRLKTEAAAVVSNIEAPLRIAAFSSIANTWLPDMMMSFKEDHPGTSFDIHVGSIGFTDMMMAGEIDMVIGYSDVCKGFRWYPLMEDPYYAVMPKSLSAGRKKITQKEFAGYRWLIAPLNAMDRNLDVTPENEDNIRVVTDDDRTLFNMVASGMGVTAVPKLFIEESPAGVEVLEFDPVPVRQLGIFLSNSPSKKAKAFADYLISKAKTITGR